jgi:hypothetical protein
MCNSINNIELNQKGSLLTEDISYLEPLNRHKIFYGQMIESLFLLQVYIFLQVQLFLDLFGSVIDAANVSFSFGSVPKAVTSPIRIGTNTSIGDNTSLDTSDIRPQ